MFINPPYNDYMIKPIYAALLLTLSVSLAYGQDAASAARDKGYKAEAAATTPEEAPQEDTIPSERPSEPKSSIALPPQRPLGSAERRAAASGTGGTEAGSSAGISCEQSAPPLTRVIRVDFPDLITGRVWPFTYGPNEAISVKFTTPLSGFGGFTTYEHVSAGAPTPMLINVSETPCDFNVETSMAGATARAVGGPALISKWDPCHNFNGDSGTISIARVGQVLPTGVAPWTVCRVKPGKTYYFNMRSFENRRDACAELVKTHPNLKCGGIWQFNGSEIVERKSK